MNPYLYRKSIRSFFFFSIEWIKYLIEILKKVLVRDVQAKVSQAYAQAQSVDFKIS